MSSVPPFGFPECLCLAVRNDIVDGLGVRVRRAVSLEHLPALAEADTNPSLIA